MRLSARQADAKYFNPRPHEEGDYSAGTDFELWDISIHALTRRATRHPLSISHLLSISIHALTRRATRKRDKRQRKAGNFNPRPHEEGDNTVRERTLNCGTFQSTPSRGGRHVFIDIPIACSFISIHALTRRATTNTMNDLRTVTISIHALTRRATANSHKNHLPKCMFIRQYINKHAYNWQRRENSRLFSPFLPLFFGANLPVFLCTHRVRI